MMSLSNSIDSPGVRSSNRLEAYSDALFSIVATVMIVPIAHTKLPDDESLASSFIRILLPRVFVFVYSFLMVTYSWATHVWLFESLEKVDEFIVLVNLGMMMLVSFQPFTFTLLSQFPLNWIAIVLFAGTLLILSCAQLIFIYHAFRNPQILKPEIRRGPDLLLQRNQMFLHIATPGLIALVALIVTIFSPIFALVVLAFILVVNWVRKKILDCYAYCRHRNPNDGVEDRLDELRQIVPFRQRMLNETVNKERIEFLSDGVFAIVATLIILDICETNIPSQDAVDKYGSLVKALGEESTSYIAYAGCFVTVALQWYVHHSLLNYITEMNKLMVIFNHLCLLSVALTPLAFSLTSDYNKHDFGTNEAEAIEFNCIVIFLAGMFQAAIWITALFKQDRHLSPPAFHGGKDHIYMSVKLSVYPLMSLFVYFLTIWATNFKVTAFVCMQVGAIAIFSILGLSFTKLWNCFGELQSPLNYLEPSQFDDSLRFEESDRYSAGSESSTQAGPISS